MPIRQIDEILIGQWKSQKSASGTQNDVRRGMVIFEAPKSTWFLVVVFGRSAGKLHNNG